MHINIEPNEVCVSQTVLSVYVGLCVCAGAGHNNRNTLQYTCPGVNAKLVAVIMFGFISFG